MRNIQSRSTLALASLVLAAACTPTQGSLTEDETETVGDTTEGTPDDPTEGGVNEPPGEEAGSSKPRNLAPDTTPEELKAAADDERDFAVALFNALPAGADNRAISPTSLRIAFAMAYEGARGDTEKEIRDAMRFSLDKPRLHAGFNRIDLELEKRNLPPSGEVEGDDSVQISLVNQMFGRIGVPWIPEFLDVLAVNYGSSLRLLDIAGDPEAARLAINAWVGGETSGKIPELLPMQSLGAGVTGVLINALYLKAPWKSPFSSVWDGEKFTREDGVEVDVAMMNGSVDGASYYKGEGVEAVEIPLRGDELTMVVILPEAGTFGAYVGALDGAGLGAVFAGLTPKLVQVSLPRFQFASDLPLKNTLMTLGMNDAFELGEADFTGAAGQDMAIAEVYHDTYIGVDEKGIEAAAASAIVFFETDGQQEDPEVELRADRPFLFAIRDRGTDALLFLGRVQDPSVK